MFITFKSSNKIRSKYKYCLRLYSVPGLCANSIEEKSVETALRPFEDIPGPKSYPVIGTLYKYLPFIGDYNAEALDAIAWLNWRRYGPLVRECPGINLVHVYDPDDIAAVFRHDDKYPARRSHVAMLHYRLGKPDVYNTGGLLATNGSDWWKLRSVFQKNFSSPQSVKEHITNTDDTVQNFIDWIKKTPVMKQPSCDLLPYLSRLNLEVIGKIAFNEDFNSFSEEEQHPKSRSSKTISAAFGSNTGIMKLDKGFMWRIVKTPLYRRLAESQTYLEKVSLDILYRKAKFFESTNDGDTSILNSHLQLSDVDLKDITGMMVDILMASVDTTAYTSSFMLYHLGRNQECQDRLFNEVSTLLPNKDSEITPDVISKAVHLRCCVKEGLRLNPVSIGVGRVTQKDLVLRGYLIPKGTIIVTQNMVASRLPQNVNDPLAFKPERWLRGSPHHENIHPFMSLPFGFGPRTCIARRLAEQNIQVLLLRMIREFKMTWKGGDLGIVTHLINKPDKPVLLSFAPRDK